MKCPRCGTELVFKGFINDDYVYYCQKCDGYWKMHFIKTSTKPYTPPEITYIFGDDSTDARINLTYRISHMGDD